MNVIVGCECSGIVRDAFRRLGHNAWSCDLKPAIGPHLHGDIRHFVGPCDANNYTAWDLGIFHPPCTYLTITANKWFKDQPPRKSGALVGLDRRMARQEAIRFFMFFVELKTIRKKCIENPIGCMNTIYREPDQIIHPYYFGDSATKSTCLWLFDLPKLFHAKQVDLFNTTISHVDPGEFYISKKTGKKLSKWYSDVGVNMEDRQTERSKTFPGIAAAMADQWTIN